MASLDAQRVLEERKAYNAGLAVEVETRRTTWAPNA